MKFNHYKKQNNNWINCGDALLNTFRHSDDIKDIIRWINSKDHWDIYYLDIKNGIVEYGNNITMYRIEMIEEL